MTDLPRFFMAIFHRWGGGGREEKKIQNGGPGFPAKFGGFYIAFWQLSLSLSAGPLLKLLGWITRVIDINPEAFVPPRVWMNLGCHAGRAPLSK